MIHGNTFAIYATAEECFHAPYDLDSFAIELLTHLEKEFDPDVIHTYARRPEAQWVYIRLSPYPNKTPTPEQCDVMRKAFGTRWKPPLKE